MTIARLHLITPEVATALAPAGGPARGSADGPAMTWSSVSAVLAEALAAGADWVQVRAKRATDRERVDRVREAVAACRGAGATCVVDDRCDLALAGAADGVHVGAEDLPVADARALLGPRAVVGATCRNAEDARRARDDGASYLGVGPVFATSTKVGLPDPIGLAGLAAVVASVDLPVIAISGITAERVPGVLDAGAHGVAVVHAVFGATDPGAATAGLLAALALADGGASVVRGVAP